MSSTAAPTAPEIRLVNAFRRPFENAIATARTCYSSSGIISEAQVSGDDLQDDTKRAKRRERRDELARSIYQAGHHTTLQHAHFQFAMSGVSRHFIWSFLHSHPYYNSEQVSQRYVEVRPEQAHVPALAEPARSIYLEALDRAHAAYKELTRALEPTVRDAYHARFPGRRSKPEKYGKEITKRCQEVARYVLPVATHSYLYHTISGLTLLRYHRMMNQFDVPAETRLVVGRMVELLLEADPLYRTVLEEPIALEDTPEHAAFEAFASRRRPASFISEWDADMEGRFARLVDSLPGNERHVANAVREVLGLGRTDLPDADAIDLAMDPRRNGLLAESMNVGTHSKLTRCLYHAHYVFKKRLSHTADSQEQRHRMTPGSRPILLAHSTGEPDYIVPSLADVDPNVRRLFDRALADAWTASARLVAAGASAEDAFYLLPNALTVRFTESADLFNLRHRLTMRLCFNAQEEIWRASRDELLDVRRVDPQIGRHLGAPCDHRFRAGARPICPEGERFCGVPAWKIDAAAWQRSI